MDPIGLLEGDREVVPLPDDHDGDLEIGAPSVEAAQRADHRPWARLRAAFGPYLEDAPD